MNKELEKLVINADKKMDSAYKEFKKVEYSSTSAMAYYINMTNAFTELMKELRIIVKDSELIELDAPLISTLPYTNDEWEEAKRILAAHKKFMDVLL